MSTKTRTRRTRNPLPQDTPAEPRRTLVDLRRPLPIRRIIGPPTAPQLAEARAALDAASARLPIPVLAWRALGDTAYAHLADDTYLVHAGDHTITWTAWIRCPGGAHHEATVHTAADLTAARADTATCTTRHTPTPQPAVRHLADGLTRARASTADTQPLDVTTLRADHAQEHPHG